MTKGGVTLYSLTFPMFLLTEGGSTNPSVNDQLNRAMEFGKSKDVPNATMMEAIRKLVCKSWKLI